MSMTEEERKRHEESVECERCKRTFSELNTDTLKCADHGHTTSKFRHSLCSRCNLRCKPPNVIPVWLHNLSNYDQAFIVSNLDVLKGCEVRIIPSNKEKMIAISIQIANIYLENKLEYIIYICDGNIMKINVTNQTVYLLPHLFHLS